MAPARTSRTRDVWRRITRRRRDPDHRFELEAVERRRLETHDDWILFGPRMR